MINLRGRENKGTQSALKLTWVGGCNLCGKLVCEFVLPWYCLIGIIFFVIELFLMGGRVRYTCSYSHVV